MTRLICLTLALAAAVPLVGCGGGGHSGTNSSASTDGRFQQALKFSQCMRSHGLPNFPDPQQSGLGGGVQLTLNKSSGLNPNSATFKSALAACRKYSPGGRTGGKPLSPAEKAQFLRYSQCMRTHGVPNFPDPKFSSGGAQLQLQGIGPGSPGFDKAQKACQSVLPGKVGGGTVQKGGS
jgi:hypothetical protein